MTECVSCLPAAEVVGSRVCVCVWIRNEGRDGGLNVCVRAVRCM